MRGFLISKETLSVRMLDDSRDPTPLLKEIRDDKVSTIIIDANASISHLILRKVGPHLISPLWWVPSLISLQGQEQKHGVTEQVNQGPWASVITWWSGAPLPTCKR